MASRIRRWFEAIVYVGIRPEQPGHPVSQSKPFWWLGPLGGPLERFVSGGPAPKDPLYLTNRTPSQKFRAAAVVICPCILVAGFVGLASAGYFKKQVAPPAPELTSAEVAAKSLPKLETVKANANDDVDVLEVSVDRSSGIAIVGVVKNRTAHAIHETEIVFELSDHSGSNLGGVQEHIMDLAPNGTKTFRLPIAQDTAMMALVREVRTQ